MLFFDRHDIISQIKLRSELNKLRDDKQYYYEEVSRTKSDMDELLSNPAKLEKFAREKYLMKRDDEDVFVIVRNGRANSQWLFEPAYAPVPVDFWASMCGRWMKKLFNQLKHFLSLKNIFYRSIFYCGV